MKRSASEQNHCSNCWMPMDASSKDWCLTYRGNTSYETHELRLQKCFSRSVLMLVISCHILSYLVISCHILSYLVISCHEIMGPTDFEGNPAAILCEKQQLGSLRQLSHRERCGPLIIASPSSTRLRPKKCHAPSQNQNAQVSRNVPNVLSKKMLENTFRSSQNFPDHFPWDNS